VKVPDGKKFKIERMKPSQVERIANYMCKYLVKRTGGYRWRIRASRNLGLEPLLKLLKADPMVADHVMVFNRILRRAFPRNWRPSARLLKRCALKGFGMLVGEALRARIRRLWLTTPTSIPSLQQRMRTIRKLYMLPSSGERVAPEGVFSYRSVATRSIREAFRVELERCYDKLSHEGRFLVDAYLKEAV
jgi:hypothetical protein